ncbi:tyrosine-type recombinase/integrase [Thermodesulfobacteriota bacterium]
MAILAECPICHTKQSVKNKRCKCGVDLDKAKRVKEKVRYWIKYRLPGGKQKKESIGFSIEEARDADGKRRVQKRENRIFEIVPDAKMTFNELTVWFLDLEKVKAMKYYRTMQYNLGQFNAVLGDMIVRDIRPSDLEDYQTKRKVEGKSDSYIDQQIGTARSMINKAFDNGLVGGDVIRTFRKVKKLLKRNSNARDRILSVDEFNTLMDALSIYSHSRHVKAIVATGYYTGMRRGEIVNLTWDKVDLKNRMIQLDAKDTKDSEARDIPICKELFEIFRSLPCRLTVHRHYVFQYAGEPVHDIRKGLKRACKDAGILYGRNVKNGFTFHDLRHTFNTNMRKAGVQESVIMEITGHSTREMFDRYNTVDDADKRAAIKALERQLESGFSVPLAENMGTK